MKHIFCISVLLFSVGACASTAPRFIPELGAQSQTPIDINNVTVLNFKPADEHAVLGTFQVLMPWSDSKAKALKVSAAKHGCQLVYNAGEDKTKGKTSFACALWTETDDSRATRCADAGRTWADLVFDDKTNWGSLHKIYGDLVYLTDPLYRGQYLAEIKKTSTAKVVFDVSDTRIKFAALAGGVAAYDALVADQKAKLATQTTALCISDTWRMTTTQCIGATPEQCGLRDFVFGFLKPDQQLPAFDKVNEDSLAAYQQAHAELVTALGK